jgi:hypothetical protein
MSTVEAIQVEEGPESHVHLTPLGNTGWRWYAQRVAVRLTVVPNF